MSTTRRPATRAGDPLVDDQVAPVPVVLLGHVGQRALAGQRQRRHARRAGCAGGTLRPRRRVRAPEHRAAARCRPPRPPRPEHIKDVNTRYHDAAADEYDAKWGIDFGADRPAAGAAEAGQGARRAATGAASATALEIGSGTGYFSLNLLQLGAIERLDRDRHLAGHAARLAAHRRGARAGGRDRRRPRPRSCPSRTRASTSSSATPSSTTSPTSTGLRRIPPRAAPRRRDRLLPASPRATATAWRRCRSAPASLAAPAWRRLVGARRRAVAEAEQSDGHALESEVDVHAFAPADLRRLLRDAGFEDAPRRRRGAARQRLGLGPAHGRVDRRARSGALGWRNFAFRSYLALQKVDTRLLEPRLPAELFYNLLVSGRKPA